jgi:ATP adenylyltransferase
MSDHPKNLWAPWRMEYIEGLAESDGCFLCRAAEATDDAQCHVLWRQPQTVVLLNRFPYSSGHVLIAPRVHAAELEDLPDAVLLELMQQTRDAQRVLQDTLHAQGFNVGINLGRCAGAGLPGHLHVHVVPRWSGDTNFMAVLANTKVIPQSLAEVRRLFLASATRLGLGPRG